MEIEEKTLEPCVWTTHTVQTFQLVVQSDDVPPITLDHVDINQQNIQYDGLPSVDERYSLYQDHATSTKHYLRAGIELFMLLAIGTGLYWADAETNSEDWDLNWDLESWQKKLVTGEGVSFDTNLFTTNTLNHTFGGSMYYLAARTNNLSIPMSLLFAIAGSAIWEYVGEFSEKVSINDMIVTPFGGMAVGETFAQLGAFFDRGAKTPLNTVLSTLFAPHRRVHHWLDKTTPRRTGNVDRFGFTRDMFHQFSLWTASGLATAWNTADPDKTRDTTGVVEIGLEAQLVNIPGYNQPREIVRFLSQGNFSTLRLTPTLGNDGLIDFFIFTRVALAGYFTQQITIDHEGQPEGSSVFLGVATAFDYSIERRLGRNDDHVGIIKLPGPTLDFWYMAHGFRLNAAIDLHANFALVDAYALDKHLANGGSIAGAKSVLVKRGYYYAWGFTVAPRLRVVYRNLKMGGELRYDRFDSIEGKDRFPEEVTNDFNLKDERTVYEVWVAHTFPSNRFRLGFNFEYRSRRGELLDVVDRTEEYRYMGNLHILF